MFRKNLIYKKIILFISRPIFLTLSTVFFIFIYTVGGILLNLNRFWQFDIGYYDFGIFARAIYLASKFQAPIIDHFIVPGRWIFADHFNPSLLLFAPIFWFTDKIEALLFIPPIAVGLSAYVLYLIAKLKLKNKIVIFSIPFTYLLSIGIQNAIYFDFHELTIATLPISLCYYFIVTGRKKLFLLFFLLTLGFKESMFVFGIATAFFIFFFKKEWRFLSGLVLFLSILWAYLTTQVVIPYFSGNSYYYVQSKDLALSPIQFMEKLTSPALKRETVFYTFANYLFLPLGYLPLIPTVLMNLASRFLNEASIRWDLGLHYNAEIGPALTLGTILFIKKLQNQIKSFLISLLGLGLILNTIIFHRIIFKGPMGLSYHPVFYANTKNHDFLRTLVDKIPEDSTVAAQNNLASYFLKNKEVYILRENYMIHEPDYIVFDNRVGQNPVGQLGIDNAKNLFKTISEDQNYKLFYSQKDQFIYKHRNAK